MNNSFVRLIDGMTATLRGEVLPRLTDEFARGQVFGVINLLNTLRLRGDWSVKHLHEEVAAQRRAFEAIRTIVGERDLAELPELPAGTLVAPVDADTLLVLRDEGNDAIVAALRWLWNAPAGLTTMQLGEIEQALRAAMRNEVEVELRYSSRPMFAEMSQGTEDSTKPAPG